MKSFARNLSLVFVFLIAANSHAATVEVIAKEKAGGKVIYHGKTGMGGKFATNSLAPGSYIFEFSAQDGSAFQVALTGAKSARQIKAKGSNLAFAVDLAAASKVSGQVTALAVAAAPATAKSNANVKIINGKRYVYVRGEIGSNIGGKWVLEEDASPADIKGSRRSASEVLTKMQELGGQGAATGR